eukprot:scaffold17460_cov128-Isochrysis_galbana.AAC.1
MSALGTDRALKRRLDLFGMPASERGAPAPATVSDKRLPMQDRHGHPVAQAPARLVRLIRPPTAAAGVVGVPASRPRRLVRSATAPGRAEGGIPRLHQPTFSLVESGARASVPAAPALSCAEGGIPRLRPPTFSPVESGARVSVPVAPAWSRAEGGVPRPLPPTVSHVESGARALVPVAPAWRRAEGGGAGVPGMRRSTRARAKSARPMYSASIGLEPPPHLAAHLRMVAGSHINPPVKTLRGLAL